MNFEKKAILSLKWRFAGRLVNKGLSFITFLVVARFLEPSAFGLFAMAFIVIDGLAMFQSLGIDSALIQRKEQIEKSANTAFLIFPVVGLILFAVLYFFAPFASIMLREQSLIPVIRVLGALYVIKCFSRVPAALYRKNLDYKVMTLIEISASSVYLITAITLAFQKFGVWSLVYAFLLKQIIILVGFWKFSSWRPKLEFDFGIAKELIYFGKFVFASNIIIFLVGNLDKAISGRLLGTAMLGLYAFAFNIANLVSTHFSYLIAGVMFPVYSRIQDDREKLKEICLRIIKYVSLAALPFCVGVIILAPDFLRVIYGPKWLPAAGVLRILALGGLLRALKECMIPIFLAVGKPKLDFRLNIYQLLILGIVLYPLVKFYGIVGAGIATTVSYFVLTIFGFRWGMDIIKIKIRTIWETICPALIGTTIIAFVILVTYAIPLKMSIYKLSLISIISAIAYAAYMLKTKQINLVTIKAFLT